MNKIVKRPWGKFEVLWNRKHWMVKRLLLNPKSRISLQKHRYRSEKWIIISGKGKVIIGKQDMPVIPPLEIDVPRGEVHRLANTGNIPMEVIEIAHGSRINESDILRVSDDYGRVK